MVWQTLANGLLAGSAYGLWALSFNLIYRSARVFHVAQAATFMLSGYTVWLLLQQKVPLAIAFPAAIVVGGLIGSAMDLFFYRHLWRRRVRMDGVFLASLALSIVLENAIMILFKSDVRTLQLGALQDVVVFGPVRMTWIQIITVLTSFALWGAVTAYLRGTKTGKAIRAVGVDEEVAEIIGIPVSRIRTEIFLAGSVLAAFAGSFQAANVGVSPTSGLSMWVIALIGSLLGGTNHKAFTAGLMIGLIENFALLWLKSSWKPAIPLVVLLVALALSPISRSVLLSLASRKGKEVPERA